MRLSPTAFLAVGASATLALSVAAPLPVTVLGLAGLGTVHLVLEINYVLSRFGGLVRRNAWQAIAVVLTLIALARTLAGLGGPGREYARLGEIIAAFVVAGIAAWLAGRRWRLPILGSLGLLAAGSLSYPAFYFALLTHAHNLVPMLFLWEWSKRASFRAASLIWFVGIPVLILAGTFDAWTTVFEGSLGSWLGPSWTVVAASGFPGASGIWSVRLLVMFAFMQSLHYVVWIGFFPCYGPRVRPRVWLLAMVLGVVVGALFVSGFALGRSIYSVVAGYHVYLELPVLLLLWNRRSEPLASLDHQGSGG